MKNVSNPWRPGNRTAIRPARVLTQCLPVAPFLVLAALLCADVSRAQTPGTVDGGFSPTRDGVNTVGDVELHAMLPLPDCGVLMGNSTVRQLLANGDPDDLNFTPPASSTLFGSGGIVYALERETVGTNAGKILVGGAANLPGTPLVRLHADGSVDSSFNPTNPAAANFDSAYVILEQPDGNILVGGTFGLIRLDPADGHQIGPTLPGGVRSLALQTVSGTDYVLVGGSLNSIGGGGVLRYRLSDLTLDTSFDPHMPGDTLAPYYPPGPGTDHFVRSVAVQPWDNKIVVGGYLIPRGGSIQTNIYRFDADGVQDTTFKAPAITNTFGSWINDVAVQADGRIIIGGSFVRVGTTLRTNVARLNSDGTLDTSFNATSAASGINASVEHLAIQPNDRILVAGIFATHLGVLRLYGDYTGSECVPGPHTLTVTHDGSGGGTIASLDGDGNEDGNINCPGTFGDSCSFDFPHNSFVTLKATPDGTSRFFGWGGVGDFTDENPVVVAMTSARMVTAYFSKVHPLTVEIDGYGRVSNAAPFTLEVNATGPGTNTVQHDEGITKLAAAPLSGWTFMPGTGWELDGSPVTPNGDGTINVNVDGPHTVRATFISQHLPPTAGGIGPGPVLVLAGRSDLTLSVLPGGSEPFTYQWFRLPHGGGPEVAVGGNSSTYTLPATDVVPANEGDQYRVHVTNPHGMDDSTLWTLSFQRDYGDAPDFSPYSFPTTGMNAARHILWAPGTSGYIYLGNNPPDSEYDGQPISGDGADEDGVTWNPIYLAISRDVTATVTAHKAGAADGQPAGKLDAWIDFNGDGKWLDTDGERIATNKDMFAGANSVSFTIPATTGPGVYFARFRISAAGVASPSGEATEGEVEDYPITVKQSPITLPPTLTVTNGTLFMGLSYTEEPGWSASPVVTTDDPDTILRNPPAFLMGTFFVSFNTLPHGMDHSATVHVTVVNGALSFTHDMIVTVLDAQDTDGIPDAVEDGVALDRDGNGDGTADSAQLNVASLPATDGTTYLTLYGPSSIRLVDVHVSLPPSGQPGAFPYGVLSFKVEGVSPAGASVTLTLRIHGTLDPMATYYKFGPATPGAADSYYPFEWTLANPTGAEIGSPTANEITLHLKDGSPGDSDWLANGVIVDPGGPVILAVPQPTLSISPLPANQAQITWPLADGGAVLQYTTNVAPPINWQTDSGTVVTNGDNKSVTIDLNTDRRFYRLGTP